MRQVEYAYALQVEITLSPKPEIEQTLNPQRERKGTPPRPTAIAHSLPGERSPTQYRRATPQCRGLWGHQAIGDCC
jgi:hypothetical protein